MIYHLYIKHRLLSNRYVSLLDAKSPAEVKEAFDNLPQIYKGFMYVPHLDRSYTIPDGEFLSEGIYTGE